MSDLEIQAMDDLEMACNGLLDRDGKKRHLEMLKAASNVAVIERDFCDDVAECRVYWFTAPSGEKRYTITRTRLGHETIAHVAIEWCDLHDLVCGCLEEEAKELAEILIRSWTIQLTKKKLWLSDLLPNDAK